MNIERMDIEINNLKTKSFSFLKEWNIITSDGVNSQGKSTIIRSILFGLGFLKRTKFVDGTKIEGLRVYLFLRDQKSKEQIVIIRENDDKILIKRNNIIEEISFKNGFENLISFYKQIFKVLWNVIPSYLFSSYFDQQWGNIVVNRGKSGPFDRELNFSIEELTCSLDDKYNEYYELLKSEKEYNEIVSDIEFIRGNVKPYENNAKLEFDYKDEKNLIIKMITIEDEISFYKKLITNSKNKLNLWKFLENNLNELNLVYKDKNGSICPLTIDNFSISTDVNQISTNERMIESKIKLLEKDKKDLTLKLENIKRSVIANGNVKEIVKNMKGYIVSQRPEMTDGFIKEIQEKIKEMKEDISNKKKKIENKSVNKISENFAENIVKFSEVNKDIKIWHENNKENYLDLLKPTSKFTTYVGAIRFIISTSFKFSVASFLYEQGINLPIIIDNIFPEELDEPTKRKFLEILGDLKQIKIITSLDNSFIEFANNINKDNTEYIVVRKDIFQDQTSLFSANE